MRRKWNNKLIKALLSRKKKFFGSNKEFFKSEDINASHYYQLEKRLLKSNNEANRISKAALEKSILNMETQCHVWDEKIKNFFFQ